MVRSIPSYLTAGLALLAFGLSGCQDFPPPEEAIDEPDPVGIESSPIVDGTRERGEPAVVMLWHDIGSLCSASVISPRVVLTAKHCVTNTSGAVRRVTGFTVAVGDAQWNIYDQYDVTDVRVPRPGGDMHNTDFAIVILARDFEHGHKRWEHTAWPGFGPGARITAVGYGMTDPSDDFSSGAKYRREGRVVQLGPQEPWLGSDEFVSEGDNVCPGDSGGPHLFHDIVCGISSRILTEDCSGYALHTRVYPYADEIRQALRDTGGCVPTSLEVCNGLDDDCWEGPDNGLGETCACSDGGSPSAEICDGIDNDCNGATDDIDFCACTGGASPSVEVCDGIDNDCNGELDEGCLGLGEPCTTDEECTGGRCRELDGEVVCTSRCVTGSEPCPAGGYCGAAPCTSGYCRAGRLDGALGSSCSSNGDCASAFCVPGSDGERRCARPCTRGGLDCYAVEICHNIGEGCGACELRTSDALSGLRFGDPCHDDAECRSDMCFVDGDPDSCGDDCTYRYCAVACGAEGGCPDDAHCRGDVCVRGPASELGDTCVADGDCVEGRCMAHDGAHRCVLDCGEGAVCEAGYSCVDGAFCWPNGTQLGDPCGDDGACEGGSCISFEDELYCADPCEGGGDCPAGTSCIPIGDGSEGACLPSGVGFSPPSVGGGDDEGGCNCGAAGAPRDTALLWATLLALALVARIRHR